MLKRSPEINKGFGLSADTSSDVDAVNVTNENDDLIQENFIHLQYFYRKEKNDCLKSTETYRF
jgi:hypothetical protein